MGTPFDGATQPRAIVVDPAVGPGAVGEIDAVSEIDEGEDEPGVVDATPEPTALDAAPEPASSAAPVESSVSSPAPPEPSPTAPVSPASPHEALSMDDDPSDSGAPGQ